MESGLSERLRKRAEAKAELSFGQALWYAWGRLDSGQYGKGQGLDAFEFANIVKTATLSFELQETYVNESIQGQWGKYVAEKPS